MSELREYQVDHLLLLVGSNPVPNVVAGKLLTVPGGSITLIHSADGLDLAQRLKSWFVDGGYAATSIGLKQVEESNAVSVYEGIQEVLEKKARMARVGLNYTGGTKVMSVQAHRALENWASSPGRDAVFSYLDARTLRMCFDPACARPAISFYVGRGIEIGTDELLALHNWEPIKDPLTVPMLPESAKALLALHSNLTIAEIWTKWLRNELFPVARKQISIPSPFWVFQSGKELQGQYNVKQPGTEWKKSKQMQNQEIPWPNLPTPGNDLPTLRETMSNEVGQHDAEHLNLSAAKGRGCKDEKEFCRWLSGTWLESAVLSVLQDCREELHLSNCCMNIEPRVSGSSGENLFEFDVVAIRGYQLFAFSCSTDVSKGLLKQKLFEVYVRARQMGGDEACAALVCCATKKIADELEEEEMRRDIALKGRIRVFGHEQLADLTRHIKDWVREQSGNPKQEQASKQSKEE